MYKIELIKKVLEIGGSGLGLKGAKDIVGFFEKEEKITLIEEPRIEVHIQRVDHLILPPQAGGKK